MVDYFFLDTCMISTIYNTRCRCCLCCTGGCSSSHLSVHLPLMVSMVTIPANQQQCCHWRSYCRPLLDRWWWLRAVSSAVSSVCVTSTMMKRRRTVWVLAALAARAVSNNFTMLLYSIFIWNTLFLSLDLFSLKGVCTYVQCLHLCISAIHMCTVPVSALQKKSNTVENW